VLLWGEN